MPPYRNVDSEILTVLGEVRSTVKALHETVEKLDHRLYGNGQPGDIAALEDRLEAVEDHQVKSTGWIAGAMFVLAAIAGAAEFLWHLVFKKG